MSMGVFFDVWQSGHYSLEAIYCSQPNSIFAKSLKIFRPLLPKKKSKSFNTIEWGK